MRTAGGPLFGGPSVQLDTGLQILSLPVYGQGTPDTPGTFSTHVGHIHGPGNSDIKPALTEKRGVSVQVGDTHPGQMHIVQDSVFV